MHAGMGSPEGWIFFAGVVALFGWGIRIGVKGLRAPHAGEATHGHRPNAPAAYAWQWMEEKRDLYRVA